MQTSASLPPHLVQARLKGLYIITHGALPQHLQMARAAVEGGAGLVQLRAKNFPLREALQIALQIRELTRAAKMLFIVNDRVDLALAANADGVHLGDDDLPPGDARRIMGRHAVIGVSASTVKEAKAAAAQGVSYLGVGAIFATASKTDAGAPIGLDQLRRVVQNSTLPVAAIGGIDNANIQSVIRQGAEMACVISAIANAETQSMMTARARELAHHFSPHATL